MALNLIERFVSATEGSNSPVRFRRWAGLALVSTLMSRRCWTDTIGVPLYGNLFIVLVGTPGSGKGEAIEAARLCVKPWKGTVFSSPNLITPESFAKELGIAFPDVTYMPDDDKHSYGIYAEELGVFLKEPDVPFMQALAGLWACQAPDWEKSTKTQGCDHAFDPYVTMLAGAQPGWFARVLDRAILEMGLPGRIHFVLSRETLRVRPFHGIDRTKEINDFIPALQTVLKAEGFFPFTGEAREAYLHWWDAECPGPKGPIEWNGPLAHYASRRAQHAAKLAFVHAVATHPGRNAIEPEDVTAGIGYLWDAEADLDDVMGMISANSFRGREQEVLGWVAAQAPLMITEAALRAKLAEQIPSNNIEQVLKELVFSGRLEVAENRLPPNRKFIIGPEYKQ